MIVRFGVMRNAGWDDYAIFGAAVFNAGYLAEVIVGKTNHMGFEMQTLTLENMTNILKVLPPGQRLLLTRPARPRGNILTHGLGYTGNPGHILLGRGIGQDITAHYVPSLQ